MLFLLSTFLCYLTKVDFCTETKLMKIIIVDDDKLAALSLKTILETEPEIEVLAMGNDGLEAISLYDTYKIGRASCRERVWSRV